MIFAMRKRETQFIAPLRAMAKKGNMTEYPELHGKLFHPLESCYGQIFTYIYIIYHISS
jgi:hypothetical protein